MSQIKSPQFVDHVRKDLKYSVDRGERILVVGDSDCDGITATAIMYLWLKGLGATKVEAMVNERNDGYGFSPAVAHRVVAWEPDTLVVVDFGTNSHEELLRLDEALNMQVIVLDHHKPTAPHGCDQRLLEVNPHRTGGHGQELCGAGIAWTVTRDWELIDLAALGTVVDRMPMTGSNVPLVRMGMERMRQTSWPGLRSLLGKSSVDERVLGWDLGPCINAAGRMGDAAAALHCLIEDDEAKADNAARLLKSYNRKRKKLQKKVEEEARLAMLGQGAKRSFAVYVEKAGEGMVGPVAGRLAEETGRPVFVCTDADGNNVKCSGRAPKGFDLHGALAECDDVLVSWGGHQSAAGAVVSKSQFPVFVERFEQEAEKRPLPKFEIPRGRPEQLRHILSPGHIEEYLGNAPYGLGNPEPLYELRNLEVVEVRTMSDGLHLRLVLREGDRTADAVHWRAGTLAESLEAGDRVTVSAKLRRNTWQGRGHWELELARLEVGMR